MKIGIIGAGQLGRMLALAGYPLGLRFVFLDQSAHAPGGQVGSIITGDFDDVAKLRQLAEAVDLVTFDVENVSVEAVSAAIGERTFLPPMHALDVAQDRLKEKRLFGELGIPTPRFAAVDDRQDLQSAIAQIGLPAVLKTRRFGYDGKGQRVLRTAADVSGAWDALGGRPLILESWVAFDREISLIGVRSTRGEIVHYPISENTHEAGILRYSIAPLEEPALQQRAEAYLQAMLEHFDYAGVLTIEFFIVGDELIANEIAPRVHNSGHWTIEGATTSQFENHIRAVLGLPLGRTTAVGHSAMVNFLGRLPELVDVLTVPGVHFHSYGKTPRPQRKLGHCTINTNGKAQRDRGLSKLLALSGFAEGERVRA